MRLKKQLSGKSSSAATKTEGELLAHVLSDRIAIVTPLSEQAVEISMVRRKTRENEQDEVQVITTANTYIILPGVRFRMLPQGGDFHMAVLLLKNPGAQ